jgi:hypothetical protein
LFAFDEQHFIPNRGFTAMRFARWVFLLAGIYGIVAIGPQYFMEEKIGQDYPPAITHPEYFYGFIGVGLAWQVAFLIIARDPARFEHSRKGYLRLCRTFPRSS